MRELVIGDVHFGIKANSINWLETQLELFRKQIIPAACEKNIDRVIFLGDLFDIRYYINQQIGIEVKNLIREFSQKFPGDIYFIAGNHDYYTPLEDGSYYNAYELAFGPEFIECHPNLKIINKDPVLVDGSLMLPWYYTENTDHFDDILYRYDFRDEVQCIYCHADLGVWPGPRITALKNKPVYSGHIHNVTEYEYGNLHNIGSVLPMTFADVNEERYFYIIENHQIVERIQNVTTPMFKRIYNEDIFKITEEDIGNSYIQICISNSNINKANYIDQIKFLKTTYVDANIRVHIVDDYESETVKFNPSGMNTNINEYIETNIPDELKAKFEYIKQKISK